MQQEIEEDKEEGWQTVKSKGKKMIGEPNEGEGSQEGNSPPLVQPQHRESLIPSNADAPLKILHDEILGLAQHISKLVPMDWWHSINLCLSCEGSHGKKVRYEGKVDVTLQDGQTFNSTVIYADLHTDIAIVKINFRTPFPAAKLGSSHKLCPGD
ncbi:putative protease Do-like 14 [Camellia lanceoleosa]|uniref:Protease Do-like 14 n=1 Tax=Camellia lanceoleosa TaxID=1840588 RepID=A0ACC0FGI6_9ERIC|nr:putative protease Do-like 14 [Camellia lanceoleosa]